MIAPQASRALDLSLGGRYSLANKRDMHGNRREFACRTSSVSPYHILVQVPVVGTIGERVISYFGEFGKIDGWISETVAGGFLYELTLPKERRDKLASTLTWLEKQQRDPNVRDARARERIIPANPHSSVILADGSTHGCFVIDMSISGVAISADVQPAVGTPLAIGRAVGRVIRHFREGFAVKFIEEQKAPLLEHMVIHV